jgi:hypothetical protein
MTAEELRRKLQAETECSLADGGDYVDPEIGLFLEGECLARRLPDGVTQHGFWSEQMQLLSDEELMFLWACFKM